MLARTLSLSKTVVALLAEGVDRNLPGQSFIGINVKVALLAEGVDRNLPGQSFIGINVKVALLAEGVDRNSCKPTLVRR